MFREKYSCVMLIFTALFFLPLIPLQTNAQLLIADHTLTTWFDSIPASFIESVHDNCKIYYGHTSHGSQIISGMDILYGENSLYQKPVFYEWGDDLGGTGDTSWVPNLRSYLDAHPDYNMAMMSWCGGVSDNTVAGINIYLNKMTQLESDYPSVKFIYMTGHLDGSGPDGNLYARNNQIRDYCRANNKLLFDFADIESYDPAGNYYPDESDACNWCYNWCAMLPPCCDDYCAHSHCFNCYLKGKTFWVMLSILEGWVYDPDCCLDVTGDINCSSGDQPDVSDISRLIDFLYGTKAALCCPENSDTNGSGGDPDISDIVRIIDYLYINHTALALCPEK